MKVHHRFGPLPGARQHGRVLLLRACVSSIVALSFGCSAAGGGGGAPEESAGSGDRNGNRDAVTAPDVLAPVPRPGVIQAPPPNLVTVSGDEEGLAADGEPARVANPAPTAVPSAAPAAGAADEAEDAAEEDDEEEDEEDAAGEDEDADDDDDTAEEDEGD